MGISDLPPLLKFSFFLTLVVIVALAYRKKPKRPSKLDMSYKKQDPSNHTRLEGIKKVHAVVVEEGDSITDSAFFIFKRKRYCGWQVLGLPIGSPDREIRKAHAKKTSEAPAKKELYDKALKKCLLV